MIQNPILRGFYPDPSICRVGDEFYLVTSSFSFFPGVPIFYSRDLEHWEQIGHVLDRPEQLHTTYEDLSMGIFAPTIRYHDGIWYMITTNMTTHENFYCTASDPAGRWSNPVVIRAAGGIDPSLFFDDDGRVYYTGTSPFGDPRYDHQMILCGELDLQTGQIRGKLWPLWDGAAKQAYSPEAPHLYKRNGWYYLMIAEGGTEHYHAVTIARSRSLTETFESNPCNPILTHRHLGWEYPICNVGHGDLVELADHSWYMVCLGSRLVNGYHKPLGRETFLAEVVWEEDWPVVSPGSGTIEWNCPSPKFVAHQFHENSEEEDGAFRYVHDLRENFDGSSIGPAWNFCGTPYENFAQVKEGALSIRMLPQTMVPQEFEGEAYDFFGHMNRIGNTRKNMPFIGRRIQEFDFEAEASLKVQFRRKECAGICILQNQANQLRLELCAGTQPGTIQAQAVTVQYGLQEDRMHYEEQKTELVVLPASEEYLLFVHCRQNHDTFSIHAGGETYVIAEDLCGDFLGSETAGGFIGAYIGMYASACGEESQNEARFSFFNIQYEQDRH